MVEVRAKRASDSSIRRGIRTIYKKKYESGAWGVEASMSNRQEIENMLYTSFERCMVELGIEELSHELTVEKRLLERYILTVA